MIDYKGGYRSLSGRVVDPSGSPLDQVLVERITKDSWDRLAATFTNANGFFSLANSSRGKQRLKFSKPGFDTELLTVVVNRRGRRALRVSLVLSV